MATKRKVGRPKAVISATAVRRLAELGCSHEEIASVVGCERSTIERNFAAELSKGKSALRIKLRRRLLKAVEREDVAPAILIFALKSICGLSEEPAPPAATVEFCIVAPSPDARIPCSCIQDTTGPKQNCSICHGAGTLPTQVTNA